MKNTYNEQDKGSFRTAAGMYLKWYPKFLFCVIHCDAIRMNEKTKPGPQYGYIYRRIPFLHALGTGDQFDSLPLSLIPFKETAGQLAQTIYTETAHSLIPFTRQRVKNRPACPALGGRLEFTTPDLLKGSDSPESYRLN